MALTRGTIVANKLKLQALYKHRDAWLHRIVAAPSKDVSLHISTIICQSVDRYDLHLIIL
jgi:hypothetical protein